MPEQTVYDGCRRHDYKPLGEVCTTLHAMMGTGGGNVPIVLQRRFSNITWTNTETAPTIEAGAGGGGNNLPMIVTEKDDAHDDSDIH